MRLVFTPNGWDDYTHWLSADRATLKRINRLIDDALRDPTAGIGKPEPLRHMLAERGRVASRRSIVWCAWSTATTSSSCRHDSTTTEHPACRYALALRALVSSYLRVVQAGAMSIRSSRPAK